MVQICWGHTEILDKSRGFPLDVTANVKIWFNFLHFFTWLIRLCFFPSFLPTFLLSLSLSSFKWGLHQFTQFMPIASKFMQRVAT